MINEFLKRLNILDPGDLCGIKLKQAAAFLPFFYTISIAQAMDTPPPPQRVASPSVFPRCFIA